jgi:hypothetical protein
MRTPKNLFTGLTVPPEADVSSSVLPKPSITATLLQADRKEWIPARSKLGSASGSAVRSQTQGHMQHRRLGQRHR